MYVVCYSYRNTLSLWNYGPYFYFLVLNKLVPDIIKFKINKTIMTQLQIFFHSLL